MSLATHWSGYFAFAAVPLISAMSVTAAAEPSADAVASARAAVAGLPPKDVGARYGQALGAVEICIGAKVTDKASALNSVYSGSDLEAFKAQAAKIYDAWLKVKNCVRQDDPNQCKVIMDESCAAAIAEIGPAGTAVPGLLDAPPR
jgi:hypothetical protein